MMEQHRETTACNSVETNDRTFSLGTNLFDKNIVAGFFENLRSLGMEGRFQMPKYEGLRQYVICGVFSYSEIISPGQSKEMKRFTDHLIYLDNSETKSLGRKFVCHGRIAVLLNFGKHGEARLFDPNGDILRHLGVDENEETIPLETKNFLTSMKEKFVSTFGHSEQPYIVLLSHLIPCTVAGHMCARLIREYIERTAEHIIISYDNSWQGTDTREALTTLTHDNIRVIKPRWRRAVVNKDMEKWQHESGWPTQSVKKSTSFEDRIESGWPTQSVERSTSFEDRVDKHDEITQKRMKRPDKKEKFLRHEPEIRARKSKNKAMYRRQSSKCDRLQQWD